MKTSIRFVFLFSLLISSFLSSPAFAEDTAKSCAGTYPGDVDNVRAEAGFDSVFLTWDPATDDERVMGYEVWYGTESVVDPSVDYSNSVDVGDVLKYEVKNLDPGLTYYFAVIAYDNANPRNESACWSVEVSAELPETGETYRDLPTNHLYFDAISFLTDLGVVNGYSGGYFLPDISLNRAELLKILVGSKYPYAYLSDYKDQVCFKDVPPGQWYTPYVCFAKAQGIVSGYSDGSFRPEQSISLVEALKISLETYGYTYPATTPWYKGVVDVSSENNFIPLSFTRFQDKVMRGEMADMLTRILKTQDGTIKQYLGDNLLKFHDYKSLEEGSGPYFLDDPVVIIGPEELMEEEKERLTYEEEKLDDFVAAYKKRICVTDGDEADQIFEDYGFDLNKFEYEEYLKLYWKFSFEEEFYEHFMGCVQTIEIENFERLFVGDFDHPVYDFEVDEVRMFSYFDEKPQYIKGAVRADSGKYYEFEIIVDRGNFRVLYNFYDPLEKKKLVHGKDGLFLEISYQYDLWSDARNDYRTKFSYWNFDENKDYSFYLYKDFDEEDGTRLQSEFVDLLATDYGSALINFVAYPTWNLAFAGPENLTVGNRRDGEAIEPISYLFFMLATLEPSILENISQPPETLSGENCELLNSCALVSPYFAIGCYNTKMIIPLLDGPGPACTFEKFDF